MKLISKKINNYDVLINKSNKYTTIYLDFFFINKLSKENHILSNLLERYITNTNSKYKTKESILKLQTDLYSFGINIHKVIYSDYLVTKISFDIIDPKLVKDDYFDKFVDAIHTLLFKPNFKNNKLDKKVFDICKKTEIGNFESSKLNVFALAEEDFYKSVFNDTFLTKTYYSIDEYKDFVNKVKDEDIINYYNNLINNSFSKLLIMGNITNANLESLKKIKFKNTTDLELIYNVPKINPIKDYVEYKFLGKQSTIKVLYEVKNYKPSDKYVQTAVNSILNNSGRILNEVYRNNLKIVYYSGSLVSNKIGFLLIEADIDAKNKKKFIDGLDNVFSLLKDKKRVESSLALYKKNLKDDLYVQDEKKWSIHEDFISKNIYSDDTLNKIYAHSKDITYEDVKKYVERLERRMIHFAKASNN